MEWSREQCLQLIDEYQKKEELWNPSHAAYFNRIRKFDAWEEIARNLDVDLAAAKKKMESLLSSFRREKSRGKKLTGTGKGKKVVYVSRWFAFDRLSFLLDREEPRKTSISRSKDKAVEDRESDSEETWVEEIEDIPLKERVENTKVATSTSVDTSATATQKPLKRKIGKGSTSKTIVPEEGSKIDETLNILKTAVHRTTVTEQTDDPYYIFGLHVANKLRKYSERMKNMAEFHINTVLYHCDMGNGDIEIRPSVCRSPLNISTSSPPCYPVHVNAGTQFSTPSSAVHSPSSQSDMDVSFVPTNENTVQVFVRQLKK